MAYEKFGSLNKIVTTRANTQELTIALEEIIDSKKYPTWESDSSEKLIIWINKVSLLMFLFYFLFSMLGIQKTKGGTLCFDIKTYKATFF